MIPKTHTSVTLTLNQIIQIAEEAKRFNSKGEDKVEMIALWKGFEIDQVTVDINGKFLTEFR